MPVKGILMSELTFELNLIHFIGFFPRFVPGFQIDQFKKFMISDSYPKF